ncbi:hypothetical protein WA588_005353, partial [Blastocystis sp. NMH]
MDEVSEIRQRRKAEDDSASYPTKSLGKRLEKLDFYPKIGDDYVIKTESGGYVSVISAILMIVLFIAELSIFLTPQREEKITLDQTLNEKMVINFNISMLKIPCSEASLDIMDISGQQQMGVMSRIVKIDLDSEQNPVNVPFTSVLEEDNNSSECGNCFGAEVSNICCNSCESLISAYRRRGWDTWFVKDYAPQCRGGNRDVLKDRVAAEGCMMWGVLEVNKVSGNFHIAVGHAESRDSRHIHSFGPKQIMNYNVTHHIEKLAFGDFIPGSRNPLDGKDVIADHLMSQTYYLKVVPTVYSNSSSQLLTNQFSVNAVTRDVEVSPFGRVTALPGVFFVYDLTPFMHIISDGRMTVGHFLVRCCAVIGGVAAIAKLLDTIMYYKAKI